VHVHLHQSGRNWDRDRTDHVLPFVFRDVSDPDLSWLARPTEDGIQNEQYVWSFGAWVHRYHRDELRFLWDRPIALAGSHRAWLCDAAFCSHLRGHISAGASADLPLVCRRGGPFRSHHHFVAPAHLAARWKYWRERSAGGSGGADLCRPRCRGNDFGASPGADGKDTDHRALFFAVGLCLLIGHASFWLEQFDHESAYPLEYCRMLRRYCADPFDGMLSICRHVHHCALRVHVHPPRPRDWFHPVWRYPDADHVVGHSHRHFSRYFHHLSGAQTRA